jgi:hypothetical protein
MENAPSFTEKSKPETSGKQVSIMANTSKPLNYNYQETDASGKIKMLGLLVVHWSIILRWRLEDHCR